MFCVLRQQRKQLKLSCTYFTPADKLTTGKKNPSILKFSNIPCTGCPLMRNEMLGTPKSKQQLTTSSDANKC